MSAHLVFVHRDEALAENLAVPYREHGWSVVLADAADSALETIVAEQPLATAYFLDSGPDVIPVAEQVVAEPRIARPLMVFLGGQPETIASAREAVPFGVFVKPEELGWVLKHLEAKD